MPFEEGLSRSGRLTAVSDAIPGAGSSVGEPGTEELAALGERLAELIEALDNHPDETVRSQVNELLQAIDRLHRDALRRLTGLLAHHQLLDHAYADPVVGMTLDIYELRPEGAEDAAVPAAAAPGPVATGVQPPAPAPPASGLIKLSDIRRIPNTQPRPVQPPTPAQPARPEPVRSTTAPEAATAGAPSSAPSEEWTELFALDQVPPGSVTPSADGKVLVVNVGGVLHAVRNRCGDSPLPLHFGELTGGRLGCTWHKGCDYDLSNGESTSGRRTIVYPVSVEADVVRVALDRGTSTGPLQPAALRAAPL